MAVKYLNRAFALRKFHIPVATFTSVCSKYFCQLCNICRCHLFNLCLLPNKVVFLTLNPKVLLLLLMYQDILTISSTLLDATLYYNWLRTRECYLFYTNCLYMLMKAIAKPEIKQSIRKQIQQTVMTIVNLYISALSLFILLSS